MWRFIFLVFVFTRAQASIAQEAQRYEQKLPYSLLKTSTSINDSCVVSVKLKRQVSKSFFPTSAKILKEISPGFFIVRIKRNDLFSLSDIPEVIFINEYHEAREELSSGASDPTLNTINYVHNRYPSLNGDSLYVSIKERLFDTSDIDLKGRVFLTGWESSFQTAHASLMATIIGGAANSSPSADGVAQSVHLTSASFDRLFPEPDSVFVKNKIYVQNHSYGTVVENFYGNEATAYDEQVIRIPTLLHVFSAGNSGNITNNSGPYSGVSAFANLTGNFKQAKNIITVGSLDSAGQLLPLSSKGPAYDGRIKPELMAYGEDGSSGAAALVSGAALLVQDAYKRNYHAIPSAALVKAVLVNSADDVGPDHPDYYSGFGNLNTFRAVATIAEARFAESDVTQNQVKSFSLVIPQGISRIKVTLAWNDPAAVPNSHKS
ncbi:MAG: S8 family serine peptidase, partial [Flavisolibacter sp.]